jgi:hypothetical protein
MAIRRGRRAIGGSATRPVAINALAQRPPPRDLSRYEKRIWKEIISSLKPGWLKAERLPMLVDLCRASELSPLVPRASHARDRRSESSRVVPAVFEFVPAVHDCQQSRLEVQHKIAIDPPTGKMERTRK